MICLKMKCSAAVMMFVLLFCVVNIVWYVLSHKTTFVHRFQNAFQSGEKKVKVTLFYETYCPYSRKFVANQLYPTYKLLGEEFIDLDLVPYGKAFRNKDDSGHWQFTCQHAEKECFGNKIHGCILEQKSVKGDFETLRTINCLINTQYLPDDVSKCIKKNKLDYPRFNRCLLNNADDILAQYGERTDANDPKVTFVPLVMIDDYFNSTLDGDATNDLTKTLCTVLNDKPEGCNEDDSEEA